MRCRSQQLEPVHERRGSATLTGAAATLAESAAAAVLAEEQAQGPAPTPPAAEPAENGQALPQPSLEEAWAVGGTCHRCWSCPGASGLRIRGKTYLRVRRGWEVRGWFGNMWQGRRRMVGGCCLRGRPS